MRCPTCNAEYPAGTRFCRVHGIPLVDIPESRPQAVAASSAGEMRCGDCGVRYPSGIKFCRVHGTPLVAVVEPGEVHRAVPARQPIVAETPAPPKQVPPPPIVSADKSLTAPTPAPPAQPAQPTGGLVCPDCGARHAAGAKFCRVHGTKLVPFGEAKEKAAPVTRPPEAVTAPAPPAQPASSTGKTERSAPPVSPVAAPAASPAGEMVCPDCGARHAAGVKFCRVHGTKLVPFGEAKEKAAPVMRPPEAVTAPAPPAQPASSTGKTERSAPPVSPVAAPAASPAGEMVCPDCGARHAAGAKFCRVHGTKLVPFVEAEEKAAPVTSPPAVVKPAEPPLQAPKAPPAQSVKPAREERPAPAPQAPTPVSVPKASPTPRVEPAKASPVDARSQRQAKGPSREVEPSGASPRGRSLVAFGVLGLVVVLGGVGGYLALRQPAETTVSGGNGGEDKPPPPPPEQPPVQPPVSAPVPPPVQPPPVPPSVSAPVSAPVAPPVKSPVRPVESPVTPVESPVPPPVKSTPRPTTCTEQVCITVTDPKCSPSSLAAGQRVRCTAVYDLAHNVGDGKEPLELELWVSLNGLPDPQNPYFLRRSPGTRTRVVEVKPGRHAFDLELEIPDGTPAGFKNVILAVRYGSLYKAKGFILDIK